MQCVIPHISSIKLCCKFTLFCREAIFVANILTFECKILRPQNYDYHQLSERHLESYIGMIDNDGNETYKHDDYTRYCKF